MYRALNKYKIYRLKSVRLQKSIETNIKSNDNNKLKNIMYGFRDVDFPLYKKKNEAVTTLFKLERCSDTTNDSTGVDCPLTTNKFSLIARAKKNQGWYINLPASQKISAEPTLSNGLVYYPIFEPSQSQNKCSLGLALICAVDDE